MRQNGSFCDFSTIFIDNFTKKGDFSKKFTIFRPGWRIEAEGG